MGRKKIIGTCIAEGCGQPRAIKGFCRRHYDYHWLANRKELCTFAGCERPLMGKGFCKLHYTRWRRGRLDNTRSWHKGPYEHVRGYMRQAKNGKRQLLHVTIAERILGRPLPPGAEVHHVNGLTGDNRPENLVICPSHAYHFLLHLRTRALDACGNVNYRSCRYCKRWDDPENMNKISGKNAYYHRACASEYRRARQHE